jgi:hypothetical protein
MNYFRHVGLVIIALTALSAHANTGCDKEIKIAALNADSRAQGGNSQCKVQEPSLSDFGVGHGIVGSVEVTCSEFTDENVPVNSGITYDFHLAPGSCEVLSIEQHQIVQDSNASVEADQQPSGCIPCETCQLSHCK